MTATRTCREFSMTMAYQDVKGQTNCATCVKYDRESERCADEQGVVQRYEDMPAFVEYDRMMRDAKDIRIY